MVLSLDRPLSSFPPLEPLKKWILKGGDSHLEKEGWIAGLLALLEIVVGGSYPPSIFMMDKPGKVLLPLDGGAQVVV